MGSPKVWLELGGETLLQRVTRLLGAFAHPLFVVRAPGQRLPALEGDVLHLEDLVEGQGPLEALGVGLQAAAHAEVQGVAVHTTDAPFPSCAVLARLETLRRTPRPETGRPWEAAIARVRGREQPLGGVFDATRGAAATASLRARGEARVRALLERLEVRWVDEEELLDDPVVREDDPELLHFLNVNTPEDYALAQRVWLEGEGVGGPRKRLER